MKEAGAGFWLRGAKINSGQRFLAKANNPPKF